MNMVYDVYDAIMWKCIHGPNDLRKYNLHKIDIRKLLKRASANRVLYLVARRLASLNLQRDDLLIKDIINKGDIYINRLRHTLKEINRVLGKNNVDYLIIKTDRPLPYITLDVDVLVKPDKIRYTMELFRKEGFKVRYFPQKKQYDIIKNGLLRIDLHANVNWLGTKFLDTEFLWKERRYTTIAGITCPVPSKTVEWCLTVAHILFERLYISLLDYLYLKKCEHEVNLLEILKQAKKYRWKRPFKLFYKRYIKLRTNGSFPYLFSPIEVIRLFVDRLLSRRLKLFDVLYYIFCYIRYLLSSRTKVPIYGDWYDFTKASTSDTIRKVMKDKEKIKVLIVCDGILPPTSKMTGMKIVKNMFELLARDPSIELHILTTVDKWSERIEETLRSSNVQIHLLDSPIKRFTKIWFLLSKILIFLKVFKLNRRYSFDIIHEYSSNEILFLRTLAYQLFFKGKLLHTILTHHKRSIDMPNFIKSRLDLIIYTCLLYTSPSPRDRG